MKYKLLEAEINYIQNPKMKAFVETALENLPDYFYTVAASSSGKYHPRYALGEGGLLRHTQAAARFAYHMLTLEQFKVQFSPAERDCIFAAILLHDGWKHGPVDCGHTVHEHPLICAQWLRKEPALHGILSTQERTMIADAIASHMGQWDRNPHSDIVLPRPQTELQKFVHTCDYLASRKDLEVSFQTSPTSELPKPKKQAVLADYTMPFGKYKGQSLIEIFQTNRGYIEWMRGNISLQEPLRTFVEQLLDQGL